MVFVSVSLSGCERGPAAADQHALGATVWETYCGDCHSRGGIGPPVSQVGLAAYRSPQGVVDYTRLAMPYGLGGTLTDPEYHAVVAYLLHENGLLPLDVAVGPGSSNAFEPDVR